MKQCPRCNRTYADDTLSFCLEDGASLRRGYDPEATQVSPYPQAITPSPPPAPTLYAGSQPPTVPAQMMNQAAAAPTPAPRQRSFLAVGAMVLAALAFGLSLGGFIFQQYNSTSSNEASASPTPRSATANKGAPTPAPTPTPSPVATPSQMATPSQSIVQSTPQPETSCVLYNDVADKAMVRVRTGCDTQDCDNDASTIAGEYPSGTPVSVIKGSGLRGERFIWVKVIIKETGQTVWVASTKVKCQ